MLGVFFRKLAENCVCPIAGGELQCGTVAVGVKQVEKLRVEGIPGILRFGIADGDGNMICQTSSGESAESPNFSVRKLSIPEFLADGASLYTFDVGVPVSRQDVYESARQRLGENIETLRSFPGDDFIAECVFGQRMEDLMGTIWLNSGCHWSVAFRPEVGDFLEAFGLQRGICDEIAQSISVDKKKCFLPIQTHHGIIIEGDRVIHFSACEKDCTNRIRTDSFNSFLHRNRDVKDKGSAVAYSDESAGVRLLARNRAIWTLFHSWEPYNLLTNNCEHFCRYCRTGGKGVSRQVIGRAIEIAGALMQFVPYKYIRILGMIISQAGGVINQPRNIPCALADIMRLTTLKTSQNKQLP